MIDGHDVADFLQRFSTKVLWHFTGYAKTEDGAYRVLKSIIESRTLKVARHPEPVIMVGGEERWIFPYSCMCDIPFKDLRIHTIRYGKYGIAFNKNTAISLAHFNPVLYVHKQNPLFKHASALLPEIDRFIEPHAALQGKVTEFLALLGTFVKPGDLTASIDIGNIKKDKEQDNNFYYEREWRSAYEWKFCKTSIEAVMIPRKEFTDMKSFLDKSDFRDIPIIPYEMVERL